MKTSDIPGSFGFLHYKVMCITLTHNIHSRYCTERSDFSIHMELLISYSLSGGQFCGIQSPYYLE